jgi:predicted lipoprotein
MLKWKRALPWCAGILFAAVFCSLFPPFHVVPLGREHHEQSAPTFDAGTFAREFWRKQLLPATGTATELAELLPALARDPVAARSRYGRSPGISSSSCFFVRGSGQVAAAGKDRVRVRLDASGPGPSVELVTGLLFGNLVRDSTGLLDVSAFPNSQEFNAISTELNRMVESEVLPLLREQAQPGKTIRFAGCIELEIGPVPEILAIVPVKVEWP